MFHNGGWGAIAWKVYKGTMGRRLQDSRWPTGALRAPWRDHGEARRLAQLDVEPLGAKSEAQSGLAWGAQALWPQTRTARAPIPSRLKRGHLQGPQTIGHKKSHWQITRVAPAQAKDLDCGGTAVQRGLWRREEGAWCRAGATSPKCIRLLILVITS